MTLDVATHDGSQPQNDRTSRRRSSTTQAYVLMRAYLFVFLAAAVDIYNVLDRGNQYRYLLLLVPVGAVLAVRLGRRATGLIRRPNGVDRVLLLLWLFGMAGTVYGAFVQHSSTTSRPIFFPLTIAFLYLFVLDRPTDGEVRRVVRALAAIGALYIGLSVVVNTGVIAGLLAFRQFRNAQFAFSVVGLTGAILLRKRTRLAVLVALAVLAFLAYPSATSILATLAMVLSLFMTRPRASSARPYFVALAAGGVVLFALLNLSSTVAELNSYFAFVHKVNANYGRLSVWSEGIQQFKASPLVGSMFSGGTVAIATRARSGSLIEIPYHNDYVLFLAQGGLVGIVLLVTWIGAFEITLLNRYRGFLQAGKSDQALLLRLLLVAFNAFFVAAAFNPVLEGMSRSATVFAFSGLAMVIGRPPPRPHRSTARSGPAAASTPVPTA